MKDDKFKVETRWDREGVLKVYITQRDGPVVVHLENNNQLEKLIVALEDMLEDD